ncbi:MULTISPECIES: RNA polymerase sigma factor [unclassified Polaribacter]|uniref:RNA polymerase sigma factor n=1 Tax=unclassified Polaribacter TaxID=196858 RepID=UPI0011BD44CB|nr:MULTISPECIES: RNA polymerase sigma-70 factor [unclassified Polaribacter]TXD54095.1 RNA polymerase sigma-70 factor [Polaribacter sp. IC063]TXD62611.1 RNA polymerase sigma-70 factor [Polaribacter sp. IC066]
MQRDKSLKSTIKNVGFELDDFNKLFETHYNILLKYVIKLCNDSEVAKDIVQEAYIKLWNKRAEIKTDLPIHSYLFKICYNEFLQFLRKKKVETNFLDDLKYKYTTEIYFEAYILKTDKEEQIKKAIEKLPKRTKEAFLLSKYEHLKYKEIAQVMDISIKTVEKHISNALLFLRTNINLSPIILFFFKS